MIIDIVIPSFHREKSLVRLLTSLFNSSDSTGTTYRVFLYIQDLQDTEDAKELVKLSQSSVDRVFLPEFLVQKYHVPVMGHIRTDAVEWYRNVVSSQDLKLGDAVVLCDDDIVFTGDLTPLSESSKNLIERDGLLGVVTSSISTPFVELSRPYQNLKKPKMVYGLETLFIINPSHHMIGNLFDPLMYNIVCGEDCYLFLKALIAEDVWMISGVDKCVWYDEKCWNDTTIDGGGLHEAVTTWVDKSVPKSMVGREESIKGVTKDYFQFLCADFMHYESAFRGGRRLRDDILEYVKTIDYSDMMNRVPQLTEFDGTHRHFYNSRDWGYLETDAVEFKNRLEELK